MSREARAPEARLSPDQAVVALNRLAAYSHHRHPSRASARLGELMQSHAEHHVEAVVGLEEALTVLRAVGEHDRAIRWCQSHPGQMGHWPSKESLELRGRVQVRMPPPAA